MNLPKLLKTERSLPRFTRNPIEKQKAASRRFLKEFHVQIWEKFVNQWEERDWKSKDKSGRTTLTVLKSCLQIRQFLMLLPIYLGVCHI